MPTTRYSYLDILKTICAFMVVFLHAGTTGTAGIYFMVVCRVAVPFFFMVTGFFLGMKRKSADVEQVYMPMIKKTGRLFVISSLFYVAYAMILWLIFGKAFSACLKTPAPDVFWYNFLVYNESPFAPHLWYLGAAFYAIIMLYVAEKCHHVSWLKKLLPVLLILALALGVYSPCLFHCTFGRLPPRNVMTTALPCILIGYMLSEAEDSLKRYAPYALPCALACAMVSMGGRCILWRCGSLNEGNVYLFTIPMAVSMFVWAITRERPLSARWSFMEMIGRQHSAGIYIYHYLFIFLWKMVMTDSLMTDVIRPWIIFILSLLLSMAINRVCCWFSRLDS